MWAASEGHTDVVKILLEKGANINLQDNEGQLQNFIITIYLTINFYLLIFFYKTIQTTVMILKIPKK